MIAQFKDITGRGLVAVVKDHPWKRPSDLPPVGSLIRLNGLVYEVRGTEHGVGHAGQLVGGVRILVKIRKNKRFKDAFDVGLWDGPGWKLVPREEKTNGTEGS